MSKEGKDEATQKTPNVIHLPWVQGGSPDMKFYGGTEANVGWC